LPRSPCAGSPVGAGGTVRGPAFSPHPLRGHCRAWMLLGSAGRACKGCSAVATCRGQAHVCPSGCWSHRCSGSASLIAPLEQVLTQWVASHPPSWRRRWKTPGLSCVFLQSSAPSPRDRGGALPPSPHPPPVRRAFAPLQHGAWLAPPPTRAGWSPCTRCLGAVVPAGLQPRRGGTRVMGWNGLVGGGCSISLPCTEWGLGDAMVRGCDAAGGMSQPPWVALVWVGRGTEHLGPCIASPVWGGSVLGVWWAVHACAEGSMRLLDPIIHWPAQLPEVDAALLRLGWCFAGHGQASSWCRPQAGLFSAAGWWFGKVGAGSYCVSGAWES